MNSANLGDKNVVIPFVFFFVVWDWSGLLVIEYSKTRVIIKNREWIFYEYEVVTGVVAAIVSFALTEIERTFGTSFATLELTPMERQGCATKRYNDKQTGKRTLHLYFSQSAPSSSVQPLWQEHQRTALNQAFDYSSSWAITIRFDKKILLTRSSHVH